MQEQAPAKKAGLAASARGRPKDPDLESKVYLAAMDVYSEFGWLGFNFDKVARQSGVGKAAIYSRWATRGDLLRDTLRVRWTTQGDIDEGSLEADLKARALWVAKRLSTSNIGINLLADGRRYTDLTEATADLTARNISVTRELLQKAFARGEIERPEDIEMTMRVLHGALLDFLTQLKHPPLHVPETEFQGFVDNLVAYILRSIAAPKAAGPDP